MANYLVTGAAGFIGSRVAELLLEDGHTVLGVDNLNDAYDVRMKHWRLSNLQKQERFKFKKLDISDKVDLESLVSAEASPRRQMGRPGYDGIINLAARAGVRQSVQNPWVYVDTNMTGTLNLLEIARNYQVPKFILASTSSIYGENAPIPTPEDADSDHPLQPYAASKKGAEAMCHAYHFLYDIDVTIFRYFTVYGRAARPDMVMFRFIQWISEGRPVRLNGDGEQSRGFTHLDDIARGTILGLKPLGFEIINLGGHESITINALIRIMEDLIGKKGQVEHLPRHPADMLANLAKIDKARRLLDWEPRISLSKGVADLVAWYNTERDWASQIETA
jgi:nucleoside-diphosphate-sugar epimerase